MVIAARDRNTILDHEPTPAGTCLTVSISLFKLSGHVNKDRLRYVGPSKRLPFEQPPQL